MGMRDHIRAYSDAFTIQSVAELKSEVEFMSKVNRKRKTKCLRTLPPWLRCRRLYPVPMQVKKIEKKEVKNNGGK